MSVQAATHLSYAANAGACSFSLPAPCSERHVCVLRESAGCFRIETDSNAILSLSNTTDAPFPPDTPLLQEAVEQLHAYFAGCLMRFDLPLRAMGTPFQQSVWSKLLDIPYGETRTYGEIALSLGKPGAARAVGMANHCNPIMLIIPCHRVIGAKGALTGFGGGIEQKRMLLELEKRRD